MPRYNKHVIVLGSARSGTSWLSENLAKPFRYRMMFEPEHDERTTKGHFLTDRYFDKNHPASREAMKYLHKLFQNRVDCDWIAQNSNRKYKRHLWPFIPKQFIIKFVRFNLSGRFLSNTFTIPTVHIIRNPFDVIESQKRVNFPWLYDFSFFLEQKHLVEIVKEKFDYDLEQIDNQSDTEKLAVRWCLENVIPLQGEESLPENYYVIKHEDLRNDINVYKSLCANLNLEVVGNLEKEYKKPSSKAHPKSTVRGEKDARNFVDDKELDEINIVLKKFRQTLYAI